MNQSVKTLILTAAVSGLLGGTTLRAAQTPGVSPQPNSKASVRSDAKAGVRLVSSVNDDDKTKHSCKGKNDCKGQGGCKTSDNGCKGKNSCKGKGGCATDGSKPPQAA
jgi:hypothetical protein